ncbi:MFS transporter [Thermomicrobiaceae bacterium CFH 74404]|uniref:MFS transporter n=1 Tax=Thermalbibacter longus TaxID=2951981 RepID=A0AA41WAZ0_9BACT|nr:MFS transporter [Thermalbibacter longus]MCM8749231.1 MFS transporter [Thermalbibacter longus]
MQATPGSRHGWQRGLYYGWYIVAALAVTETISWGILYYGFAVFLTPMERELGWSRPSVTGAFSLALLLSGLAAPLVGRWIDRNGPRLLMTAGSIAATLLVLAWSRVGSLTAFYAIWIGIGLVMAAVLYEPAFAVVAKWFSRRRRQALTALTLVAGLASVIFTPLCNWLIELLGWREALLALAILLGASTIPLHGLVLRRSPEALGLAPDGEPVRSSGPAPEAREPGIPARAALRTATFWALTVAMVLNALAVVAMNVHLIPYLLGRGYSSAFAATVTGLIGGMQLPGRLLFAPLGRVLPARLMTVLVFLLQGAALGILLVMPGAAGVLAFVVVFGMSNGMATLLRAARVAELFGAAAYGSIAGVMALWATLARAAAPVGAGTLYDLLGRYEPIFWALALGGLVAGLAAYLAETTGARLPMHAVQPDHQRAS